MNASINTSIAIFITPFLKSYIEETLRGFSQAGEFQVCMYGDFKELTSAYEKLPKTVRGIVVTSSIPARMLELTFPDSAIPVHAFDNDNAGIYRLFLELLHKDRTLSLARVFADMFDFMQLSPDSFLFGAHNENLSDIMQARVSKMTIDELITADTRYAARHIEMWKNGQIDISVTRFSLTVDRLRKAGLNVRFAYPDMLFVRNVLFSALREATIKGLTDNLPCSVIITVRRAGLKGNKLKRAVKELGNQMDMFAAEMKINYHVQKREDGFEIFTNHMTVGAVTEDYTTCGFRGFLSGDLSLDIGYGIGFSLYQAHVNAMDAAHEACGLPSPASCLKNERDELATLSGGADGTV